jgi:hypothetical protein
MRNLLFFDAMITPRIITFMKNRLMSCAAALMLLAVAAPAAAQTSIRDRDILNREHSGNLSSEERGQLDGMKASKAAEEAKQEAGMTAARMRAAQALRKTPPLPAERNGLLGSWRLRDDQRSKAGAVDVLTSNRSSLAESLAALKSFDNFGCGLDWGGGITFTPSTFSWRKVGGRVIEGAPITYRSGRGGAKQVIVAITDYDFAMAFEIASPNSILDDKGCVLVRVGAPAANAAAMAPTAPGNARAAVAGPSAPPAAGMAPQVAGAANATNAKLAVGPDAGGYLCPDGRQLYVKSCYDESSESTCGVVNMHLPPRSEFRFQVVTTEVRSEILSRVAACKILPLQFMNGTVSLVLPKSGPP